MPLPESAFQTPASLSHLLAVPSRATLSTQHPHPPLAANLPFEQAAFSYTAISVDADHCGRRSADKASFDLAVMIAIDFMTIFYSPSEEGHCIRLPFSMQGLQSALSTLALHARLFQALS